MNRIGTPNRLLTSNNERNEMTALIFFLLSSRTCCPDLSTLWQILLSGQELLEHTCNVVLRSLALVRSPAVLFCDQVLQPLVLQFQGCHPGLEGGVLLCSVLYCLLQGLLAHLLLHTETSAGGGVTTTLVLLGNIAWGFFNAHRSWLVAWLTLGGSRGRQLGSRSRCGFLSRSRWLRWGDRGRLVGELSRVHVRKPVRDRGDICERSILCGYRLAGRVVGADTVEVRGWEIIAHVVQTICTPVRIKSHIQNTNWLAKQKHDAKKNGQQLIYELQQFTCNMATQTEITWNGATRVPTDAFF